MNTTEKTTSWLDHALEGFGRQSSTKMIYGDPVQSGETTVIPVAKIRYGFGGGSGSTRAKQEGQQTGSGGGAGLMAIPAGFIAIKDGKAVFHRILDTTALLQLVVGFGLSFWLGMRGLRAISRA